MGYYCHPDTMAMSSASHRAKENADGETNTLKYLKEYRKVYEEQNKGDRFAGLEGYLSELDKMIDGIEKHLSGEESLDPRKYQDCILPMFDIKNLKVD